MNFQKNDFEDINPMDHNLDKIPEILYKYRTFDSCNYGLQLAINGQAYFASARDFNDPFENYFIPISKFTEYEGEELVTFLRKKARQHFPNASDYEINRLIEEGKKQQNRIKSGDPRVIESILEIQYNNFGIFSLSASPKSIPMWAYYGNSHKGMCIGLRSSIIAKHQRDLLQYKELLILHEVQYRDNIPEICVDIWPTGRTDDELRELESSLYIKSKQWEHEKEYRLLYYKHSSKNYVFGTDAVAEILIGASASDEHINILLKHLRISNSKAVVKRAIRSRSEYAMEFEEIHR